MTKIGVLDDWQNRAGDLADWSALTARAEVSFFQAAFSDVDDAAAKLADFDILLTMRERSAIPVALIERLPNLKMLSITGARAASIDIRRCRPRASWCATPARAPPRPMPAPPRPPRSPSG